MKKNIFDLILLISLISFTLNSCGIITTTATTAPCPTICDIKGTYTGTGVASNGATTSLVYRLQDNNLALGGVTPTSGIVTFGGYKNTCDSVFLSVNYTSSNHYYIFQGKLSNSNNTISGTFRNLTNITDFGTFTISK